MDFHLAMNNVHDLGRIFVEPNYIDCPFVQSVWAAKVQTSLIINYLETTQVNKFHKNCQSVFVFLVKLRHVLNWQPNLATVRNYTL